MNSVIDSEGDVAVQEQTKIKVKRPRKYHVILHNDDYTPMDFVVEILSNVFNRTVEESIAIMLEVHNDGKGIAGTYSKEIAEQKAYEAEKLGTSADHPLRCSIEPAEDGDEG